MAASRIRIAVVFALALATVSTGQTPSVSRLELSQNAKLLNCEPASSAPCFRIEFSVLAPDGSPAAIPLLTAPQLASSLTIDLGNRRVHPFYVSIPSKTEQLRPERAALFLVDTSGSMNKRLPNRETRFEAAKGAISYFLEGFETGVDRIAVVGFESHKVAAGIRSARFAASRVDAQSEVEALAAPKPRNNTALYSAVDIGLDTVAEQIKASTHGAKGFLYLLTDGDNDVQLSRGDDQDLLRGPAGLQIVVQKVQNHSDIQVVAVGIGSPHEVNQNSLAQISNKFEMITDADQLKHAFPHPAPTMEAKGLLATFVSPWPDRASLAAQTISLRVQMTLPNEAKFESNVIRWSTPEVGQPLFSGTSDVEESDALLRSKLAPTVTPWMTVLRPILVFGGLGAVLLILWFWVPRLVWADEYAGKIPQAQPARWEGGSMARRPAGQPAARPAPAGFEQGRGGVRGSPRAPSDATIVAPANLGVTRTRLELNPFSERDRKK